MEGNNEIKGPLEINVGEVLRQRIPRYWRFIPRRLVRWLERTVCQDELNRLLRDNFPRRDADFCRGVLDDLGVTVNFHNLDNLPPKEQTRVLFVSNHPLGGLDGMALIDFVRTYYGVAPRFIVNDLLNAVEPLSDTFIPVNKHGAQSREAILRLDGLCLRRSVAHVSRRTGVAARQERGGGRPRMAKNVRRQGPSVRT